MEHCNSHIKFVDTLARLEVKIDYLIDERKEQKERYEKRKNRIRKLQYAVFGSIIAFLSYAFENRETARLALKEWLK